ncbi:MAG: co-chaperone GroES [Deltaproteobacteria bacterium]|nr:co-chaperone GroES [Deltaproteobacteria bacterium]
MKVRPIHDRILIKRTEEEQKTQGGLFIPDTAKEKPQQGVVVAVGNGKALDDGQVRGLQVKAGDKVLFAKYTGTDVKVNNEEHLILKEDEVLAVIE